MAHMNGIIEEEYERLNNLIAYYIKEINKLPKGSLQNKNLYSDKKYVYRVYRENGKHISEYIGSIDSGDGKMLKKQISERKELEKLLKKAKENLNEVKKLMRTYK